MTQTQILIIDDDPTDQIILNRHLSSQGYEILIANNGEEGLELAEKHNPALIICDWIMPGFNGLYVCREIKNNPKLSTIFFILLTSKDSIEDKVKGLDAGADDFLCKPVNQYELKARVRAGLRGYYLYQELQKEKQHLEAELEEAAEYIFSILPKPLSLGKTEIDVCFIPSRQLGGDSFDYYWLDPENLAIYLIDVSGHGIRAALPSLSILNLLRSRNLNQVNFYQPREVLLGLNKSFSMAYHNGQYFTIWYGVYNTKKRRLVYATAGHPPAILVALNSQEKVKENRLKTPGLPIGWFSDSDYQQEYCQIESNSRLYLFSDGIYELEQADGSIWGIEEFIKILKEHYKNKQKINELLKKVRKFNLKNDFTDDLSVIQIDFNP